MKEVEFDLNSNFTCLIEWIVRVSNISMDSGFINYVVERITCLKMVRVSKISVDSGYLDYIIELPEFIGLFDKTLTSSGFVFRHIISTVFPPFSYIHMDEMRERLIVILPLSFCLLIGIKFNFLQL